MTAGELQAFVDAFPIAAMIMRDNRIVACNRQLADLTAVPLEELLAAEEPIQRFVAPEDQPAVLDRIAARSRGEPVPAELDYVGIGGSGQRIPSRAHLAPFPSAGAIRYPSWSSQRLKMKWWLMSATPTAPASTAR